MKKSSNMTGMAATAVLGVMAGAALGAVGAYAATGDETKLKKTVKKMEKGAEKAISNVEKMMNR
ncbi:MAG: hypothetical protein RR052_06925 [Oscillospiraceae bacterium]